ncbi:MAG: hypothetical protein MJ177_08905 [Clostridia bacterium]|nr:hypothetical protein [Clostridia bacterium]
MKKAICIILSAVMLALCVFTVSAQSTAEHDYTIENPYKDVIWDGDGAWGLYKASLHSHTNASDAVPSIAESVEKHYELGFDILAITDHAVLGAKWTEVPDMVPLYRLFKADNTHMKDPEVLTGERYEQITTGSDRDGKPMLEVTGALEANGAVPINDCHVNAFFANYGQALMGCYGDYETVVRRVQNQGGITFLDHTGEYVGCEDDPDRAREPYYANKFANIFLNYPSCVAFDVNSGINNRTRYDYILWDEILKLTIPNGRNVSCICFSDGHHIDQYDRAFTYMCMPSLTVDALRTSLETGAYFSIGRYARADLGEDFEGTGPVPLVRKLVVDQQEDCISFEAENFDRVRWYSDGELIAEGEDLTSFDLDDYADRLGCYVRFTLTGKGGIMYSQAFPITAPDIDIEKPLVVPTVDIGTFFRSLADSMNLILGWTPVMLLIRWLLWGRAWWLY